MTAFHPLKGIWQDRFWFWEIHWTLRGCPESSKSKRFVDRPRILWKRTRFLLTLGHPEIRAPGNQTEPSCLINENHFPPVGIGCRHFFSSNLGQDIFFGLYSQLVSVALHKIKDSLYPATWLAVPHEDWTHGNKRELRDLGVSKKYRCRTTNDDFLNETP